MSDRKQLNTPVNAEVLQAFKNACTDYGLNMSTVLDALLSDFASGNYDIVISRNEGMKVVKR